MRLTSIQSRPTGPPESRRVCIHKHKAHRSLYLFPQPDQSECLGLALISSMIGYLFPIILIQLHVHETAEVIADCIDLYTVHTSHVINESASFFFSYTETHGTVEYTSGKVLLKLFI